MTYPQVVAGGFTVVRRDSDGVVRAHVGLVLGGDDPSSCYTGYAGTYTRTPGELGAVPLNEAARCAVLDGVDPNPGDGINETGSSIRGAQEVGRTGGVANPGGVAGTGEDLLEEILDARRSPAAAPDALVPSEGRPVPIGSLESVVHSNARKAVMWSNACRVDADRPELRSR